MDLPEIKTNDYGGAPFGEHNMPCNIHPRKHAMWFMNTGIFYPSFEAHQEGWRQIKLTNWFERFVFWLVFKKGYYR